MRIAAPRVGIEQALNEVQRARRPMLLHCVDFAYSEGRVFASYTGTLKLHPLYRVLQSSQSTDLYSCADLRGSGLGSGSVSAVY